MSRRYAGRTGAPLKDVAIESGGSTQPVQEYLDAQLALARNCVCYGSRQGLAERKRRTLRIERASGLG